MCIDVKNVNIYLNLTSLYICMFVYIRMFLAFL